MRSSETTRQRRAGSRATTSSPFSLTVTGTPSPAAATTVSAAPPAACTASAPREIASSASSGLSTLMCNAVMRVNVVGSGSVATRLVVFDVGVLRIGRRPFERAPLLGGLPGHDLFDLLGQRKVLVGDAA